MTAAITFQSSTGQTVTLPPSDCIRIKPSWHYQDHFNRNSTYFGGTDQTLQGWFEWLGEPVRAKSPLPSGAMLYFAFEVPRFQYSFAMRELFDVGRFTLNVYSLIVGANVTIHEIVTTSATVNISEINVRLGAPS